MPGCLGFLPSTVGFDFGLCEIGFQVAFRQTSLDELLPVDDCAENYKGRQRQGELETAFLIALISGWSGENKTNKNKGSWMKSNCKILARYLTPQKSHWEIESQMMQLSDGAAALLLPKMLRTAPKGKKWHNNWHPRGNEPAKWTAKSWALEKVRIVQVRVHSLKLTYPWK